jgi:hypothetical protein
MKWGGYNEAAATRFERVFGKLVSSRAMAALMAFGALVAILGNAKWSP